MTAVAIVTAVSTAFNGIVKSTKNLLAKAAATSIFSRSNSVLETIRRLASVQAWVAAIKKSISSFLMPVNFGQRNPPVAEAEGVDEPATGADQAGEAGGEVGAVAPEGATGVVDQIAGATVAPESVRLVVTAGALLGHVAEQLAEAKRSLRHTSLDLELAERRLRTALASLDELVKDLQKVQKRPLQEADVNMLGSAVTLEGRHSKIFGRTFGLESWWVGSRPYPLLILDLNRWLGRSEDNIKELGLSPTELNSAVKLASKAHGLIDALLRRKGLLDHAYVAVVDAPSALGEDGGLGDVNNASSAEEPAVGVELTEQVPGTAL